jgi:hypothetical protein
MMGYEGEEWIKVADGGVQLWFFVKNMMNIFVKLSSKDFFIS